MTESAPMPHDPSTADGLDRALHRVRSQVERAVMLGTLTQLGPYRVIEVLGRGGFGVVYRAQQEHPVRRSVAVKVLDPGRASATARRYFELERQVLASMKHPNIATMIDAGETPEGQLYLVMELVGQTDREPFAPAQTITDYCDARSLGLRERLALFREVCDAVQYAHSRGVIHRDLKPSNILIAELAATAEQPARAIPKVIDFGISKLTEGNAGAHATAEGMAVGTFAYMSPEQARGERDLSTQSDVYALGAVLYELLSGLPALEVGSGTVPEVLRAITERDTPAPSLRLRGTPPERANQAARARGCASAEELARELGREVEWIPMKALHKDLARRYASAESLSADIGRYLAGLPLQAGPDSRAYRVRKYIRRNRGPVVAAVSIALALVLGLAGTMWMAREAERQTEAVQRAEAEKKRLAESLFGGAGDAQANTLLMLAEIERTVRQSEARDDFDPAIALAAAAGYRKLGRIDEARRLTLFAVESYARRFGPDDARTLDAELSAANLQAIAGETEQAETSLRALADRGEKALGPAASVVLRARLNAAFCAALRGQRDQALEEYRVVLPAAERALAPTDRDLAEAQLQHAGVIFFAPEGESPDAAPIRLALAIAEFERVAAKFEAALGPRDTLTLRAHAQLAIAMMYAGRFSDALPILAEAVPGLRSALGDLDQLTMDAVGSYAYALVQTGRVSEARGLLSSVLSVVEWSQPEPAREPTDGLKGLREAWAAIEKAEQAPRPE